MAYYVSAWNIVLEKLIFSELAKNFCILWNDKVLYSVHNRLQFIPVLSQLKRGHTLSKWLTDAAIYSASTIERAVLCIRRNISLTITLVTKSK
jgi:hypothetical protein